MGIPFLRFALPLAVLYLYYRLLVLDPWIEQPDRTGDAAGSSLTPDEARALVDRSKSLLAEKHYEQALPPMIRLNRAFPENHIYIEELANTYASLGRFADESRMWEQYLQYAPVPSEACPQIGIAYDNQSRPDAAENAFQRCYQAEPNADNILYYAHALERKGDYARAGDLYRQGLKRAPNYPDLRLGLARIDLFQGRRAEALQRALAVLDRSPDNVDGLLVAGMACARLGEVRRAREYLQHGLRLSPNYRDLQIALAGLPGRPANGGHL